MQSEVWLKELEDNRLRLESTAITLCDIIKETFQMYEMKVIVTYRIKSKTSLGEKIKRHNIDNESNRGRSIFELFSDIIGVRIICMKISDEKLVYEYMKADEEKLFEKSSIQFNDNINNQPTNQKNGHHIYKFDGRRVDGDITFPFEMQIKSLANLFWGEMEHFLFYKNSKVLISSKYYEKEINSIYDELRNIDSKLTYMEEAMMGESEDDLLNEKIEVFKRYAYIQTKELLRNEFGDYLNNKYIFNAVGDYIFKINNKATDAEGNKILRDPNEILRKILYVLLDTNGSYFDLSMFEFENLEDTRLNTEIKECLTGILRERENGWWIYTVLCGIFSYYQENIQLNSSIDPNAVKPQINICIKNLCDTIHKEIYLCTKLFESDNKYDRPEIRKVALNLVKLFLDNCRINKNLKFTEKNYATNYNLYGVKLIKELDAKNLGILEGLCDNSNFINSVHSILINTENINNIITSHVKLLDSQIVEAFGVHLEDIEKHFIANEDITVKTFFKLLEGVNEDEK